MTSGDLPALVARFTAACHAAGLPVGPERAQRLARAVIEVSPATTQRLYWCALATLVSDPAQIPVLDAVFDRVFRGSDPPVFRGDPNAPLLRDDPPVAPVVRGAEGLGGPARVGGGISSASGAAPSEVPVPAFASATERLGGREFDALSPAELARLAEAMRALRVATPVRRSRRTRAAVHGDRLDLRRTLRSARRTAGDPVALARRRRRRGRGGSSCSATSRGRWRPTPGH